MQMHCKFYKCYTGRVTAKDGIGAKNSNSRQKCYVLFCTNVLEKRSVTFMLQPVQVKDNSKQEK